MMNPRKRSTTLHSPKSYPINLTAHDLAIIIKALDRITEPPLITDGNQAALELLSRLKLIKLQDVKLASSPHR